MWSFVLSLNSFCFSCGGDINRACSRDVAYQCYSSCLHRFNTEHKITRPIFEVHWQNGRKTNFLPSPLKPNEAKPKLSASGKITLPAATVLRWIVLKHVYIYEIEGKITALAVYYKNKIKKKFTPTIWNFVFHRSFRETHAIAFLFPFMLSFRYLPLRLLRGFD